MDSLCAAASASASASEKLNTAFGSGADEWVGGEMPN